jgi:hypothetical protein
MTKGKTWRLFLMILCVFLILLAVEFVLFLMVVLASAGVVGGMAVGGAQAVTALMQQPATLLARLAPLLIIGGVLAIPLSGALLAIIAAPWARAYLDLRLDPSEAF